jgi:hypothetical protein
LFEVAGERAVLGREGEPWRKREAESITGTETEIFVDVKTSVMNDLAGIEHVVRVEGGFYLCHDVQKIFADLLADEFSASHADTMFAGEGTFELQNQCRDFVCKLAKFLNVLFDVKIEHGPDVKEAGSGVTVVGGFEMKRREDRLEARDISGQVLRADGHILDASDRFGIAFSASDEGQAGFAHGPNEVCFGLVPYNGRAQSELLFFERGEAVRHIFEELDGENGLAGLVIDFQQIASSPEFELADGLIQQDAIDVLDSGRFEVE